MKRLLVAAAVPCAACGSTASDCSVNLPSPDQICSDSAANPLTPSSGQTRSTIQCI